MSFIMLYFPGLNILYIKLCPLLFHALQEILRVTFTDLYNLNKMLLSFTLKVSLVVLHKFANSPQVTYTSHSAAQKQITAYR